MLLKREQGENPQRENKIDSPSLKGFHAQLDCKLTYGNKNQTKLTLVYHLKFCVQKQNKTGMMTNITKLAYLLKFILIMTVSERI